MVQKPSGPKTLGMLFRKMLSSTLLFMLASAFTSMVDTGRSLRMTVPLALLRVKSFMETTLIYLTRPGTCVKGLGKRNVIRLTSIVVGTVQGPLSTQMLLDRTVTLWTRLLFRL